MVVSGWFIASFEQVTVYDGARERRLVAGELAVRSISLAAQPWQRVEACRLAPFTLLKTGGLKNGRISKIGTKSEGSSDYFPWKTAVFENPP